MFDFSWVTELSAWAGLGTLVLLEVVLGVDNLVFISILVGKLPEEKKRRAFLTGLSLALLMRLVLLAAIAWIIGLTAPLFSVGDKAFSARDLILMGGGLFLLLKGTLELHERLEGHVVGPAQGQQHSVYWRVIAQIILLDAVFSLDSIITSVGMVDYVSLMMLAVITAMVVMALAAGPLLRFVERHPSVVVLCLGFLMMIGLGLLTDGLGYHIPKGYLYAAIIFAVLVEICNQWGLRNRRRRISMRDMRESTAQVVMGLLGGRGSHGDAQLDAAALAGDAQEELFGPEERDMVARVIRLSGRTARFIMTPRHRVNWLDYRADRETVFRFAAASRLPWLPVLCRETDDVLGVVRTGELLLPPTGEGDEKREDASPWALREYIRSAPTIFEHTALADILEDFRAHPAPLSFVRDEYGSVVGVITPAELLSVLAGQVGDMPSSPDACRLPDGSWRMPGRLSVDAVTAWLDIVPPASSTSATLAGLILERLGHIPVQGERLRLRGWDMEITRMDRQRIDEVRVVKGGKSPEPGAGLSYAPSAGTTGARAGGQSAVRSRTLSTPRTSPGAAAKPGTGAASRTGRASGGQAAAGTGTKTPVSAQNGVQSRSRSRAQAHAATPQAAPHRSPQSGAQSDGQSGAQKGAGPLKDAAAAQNSPQDRTPAQSGPHED